MIEIDDTITSLDVVSERFKCDLKTCKGACCIEGDGGAPLEADEVDEIEKNLQLILPYIPQKARKIIEEKGFHYTDSDGDILTMLVDDKECVFTTFTGGIAFCGIEQAFNDGKLAFRKPISCHLYPIRLTKYTTFEAVNYHKWDICDCARKKGKEENCRVFEFLKEPLVRKYGSEWYAALHDVVTQNKL